MLLYLSPVLAQDKIYLHNGKTINGAVLKVGEYTVIYSYEGEKSQEVISKYAVSKILHGGSNREEVITEKVIINNEDDWEKVVILDDRTQIVGLTKVDEVSGTKYAYGKKADRKAMERMKREAASLGCPFILMTLNHNTNYSAMTTSTKAQRKGIGYKY